MVVEVLQARKFDSHADFRVSMNVLARSEEILKFEVPKVNFVCQSNIVVNFMGMRMWKYNFPNQSHRDSMKATNERLSHIILPAILERNAFSWFSCIGKWSCDITWDLTQFQSSRVLQLDEEYIDFVALSELYMYLISRKGEGRRSYITYS